MEWIKIPYRAAWRLVMDDEGLELSGYIAFTAFAVAVPVPDLPRRARRLSGRSRDGRRVHRGHVQFHAGRRGRNSGAGSTRGRRGARGRAVDVRHPRHPVVRLQWLRGAAHGPEPRLRRERATRDVVAPPAEHRVRDQRRLDHPVSLAGGHPGALVWKVLGPTVHSVLETRLLFGTARYLFAGVLLFGALTLLHRWLPNTEQAFAHPARGRGDRGAVAARAGLFAWYVGHLTDYSAYYGSLGGVAITLMFFYISAIIFIFGAEFNAVWRERTGRRGRPRRPMGTRMRRRAEGGEHSDCAWRPGRSRSRHGGTAASPRSRPGSASRGQSRPLPRRAFPGAGVHRPLRGVERPDLDPAGATVELGNAGASADLYRARTARCRRGPGRARRRGRAGRAPGG